MPVALAAVCHTAVHAAEQRIELPNGDVYEGEIRDDVRAGQGTYIWRNGHRYTGSFADNRMHGQGTYFWPDGRTYTGSFVNDRRDGRGVLRWPNGDYYEGMFRDDQLHGRGTFVWANRNRYEGEFVAGERTGLGTYHWRDGTVFQGQFEASRMHGYGVKRLPDGARELQRWVAGELAESRPLREVPHCRLVIDGRPWMFESPECINGLAHGRGLAASLDGTGVVLDGRFALGHMLEGTVQPLRPGDA